MRNRLGLLCDQLTRHPSMVEEIDDAGVGRELRELLGLVGGGSQADQDQDRASELLDAIEEGCARHGLAALDLRAHKDVRLPDGFRLASGEAAPLSDWAAGGAWVCPWGRCGRVVFPDEVPARPECAAGREPLRPFLDR
ncbi:hypothetical protein ABZT51_09315 [Streptomyces sp. NPDC005373]|uniref:hypothetical protein n=1 Tax=Streptomyces sp. NPDC005373 TaxID=3156879 RepID=UPI0033B7BAC1